VSGGTPRGLLVGLLSLGSALLGVFLVAVGVITRQERAVAAGKRRFHGYAFERRWISDLDEREWHAATVALRLDLDPTDHDAADGGEAAGSAVSVAEAAGQLGISAATVRRRAKRGDIKGVYANGRLTGVILKPD
jgi:hypothetical protein